MSLVNRKEHSLERDEVLGVKKLYKRKTHSCKGRPTRRTDRKGYRQRIEATMPSDEND
jgi:hypothetical protein